MMNENPQMLDDSIESDEVETYIDFEDMELPVNLLRGIYSYGFEIPSLIQQKGIMCIKSKKDVIVQAQSGSGKTGTFTIGALSMINPSLMSPQILILAPTRELAEQIEDVIKKIGMNMGVNVRCCIGGRPSQEDERALSQGVNVVVGTPGRVIDLLKREKLQTDALKMFILDEADEMLNTDFQEDIRVLFKFLPSDIQVGLFSATIPPQVLDISKKFMNNPIRILVKKEVLTLDGITQFYVDCTHEEYKYDVLKELYEYMSLNKAMIFCNSKNRVDRLRSNLQIDGFAVSSIHGGMDPKERREIMKKFRENETRILISTGLLSRGIDVQQTSLILNYDLPQNKETYIHQVGRSGRYGRKGLAINFITNKDRNKLEEIQQYYNTIIDVMPENVNDYI